MFVIDPDAPTARESYGFEVWASGQRWGDLRLRVLVAHLLANVAQCMDELTDADLDRCIELGQIAEQAKAKRKNGDRDIAVKDSHEKAVEVECLHTRN